MRDGHLAASEELRVLTVDIGNTQTVIGWFDGPVLRCTARWGTVREDADDLLDRELSGFFNRYGLQPASLDAIGIASVVPPATPQLVEALRSYSSLEPVLVSARTAPIPIRVDVPEKIGADRIAVAVAAARLYPLPAIVMDVGTATTVTVVDATGSLIGGSISLGLQNSARALHQVTAQLPLSDLASPPTQIGRNTEDSIRSGLLNGTAAMLEGLAERMSGELGRPATLILTGGLSGRLIHHFRKPVHHDPELLLKGLRLIAVGDATTAASRPLGGRRLGIIGAGRLGTGLGLYLCSRGVLLSGYASRHFLSAEKAARLTGSQAFHSPDDLAQGSDMILIATPDSEIEGVARSLSPLLSAGQWLLHASGSLPSAILRAAIPDRPDIAVLSLHPMLAFASRDQMPEAIETATFALEGDPDIAQAFSAALQDWNHPLIRLSASQKPLYHLASVWASNLSLAVIARSCAYLEQLGLDHRQAEQAVWPLIRASLENFHVHGLPGALTGPVERNDAATIRQHLSAMPETDIELYRQLSLILLEQARRRHPGRKDAELAELLNPGGQI
jgi:type III pantothenate kinase